MLLKEYFEMLAEIHRNPELGEEAVQSWEDWLFSSEAAMSTDEQM
jgi:hypothetical protein